VTPNGNSIVLPSSIAPPYRTILHAGTYKTGSTAIQQWMAQHREELLEQGFWLPTTLGGGSMKVLAAMGHCIERPWHSAVRREGHRLKPLAGRIEETITQARRHDVHTLLLSSEGLGDITDAIAWKRLAQCLETAGAPISRVLLYLRSPFDRFLSTLSEAARNGRYAGAPAALLPCCPAASAWNPAVVVSALTTALGRDRVDLALFNDDVRQDLIADFSARARIDARELGSAPVRNTGLCATGRHVLAAVNAAARGEVVLDRRTILQLLAPAMERGQHLGRFTTDELAAAAALQRRLAGACEDLQQQSFPEAAPSAFQGTLAFTEAVHLDLVCKAVVERLDELLQSHQIPASLQPTLYRARDLAALGAIGPDLRRRVAEITFRACTATRRRRIAIASLWRLF
jgi:hypothetical protein